MRGTAPQAPADGERAKIVRDKAESRLKSEAPPSSIMLARRRAMAPERERQASNDSKTTIRALPALVRIFPSAHVVSKFCVSSANAS
jgi:hypothetical protein